MFKYSETHDYLSALQVINQKYIANPNTDELASFLFGFAEEMHECREAPPEKYLEEVGDLLAYLCISTMFYLPVNDAALYFADFELEEIPSDLLLFRNFKKVFYKFEALNLDIMTSKFFEFIKDLDINEVMSTNIKKLEKRVANNTLRVKGSTER